MECLQIDWENIDDTFERDEFYESIQAPKWIDFTAPLQPVDDHEWFCGKSGCTHEKKTLWQTEDSILSDSQKSMSFQIAKKVAPVAESTASGPGGKRARGVVSSSYSSLSSIKEAFAKHKILHLAKMPCVAESNGHAVKRSAHASENQNPNRTCEPRFGVSKIPILKASEGLTKKIKLVSESTCSTFSEQVNGSQNRAVLDVSKSTTLLGRKDVVQNKSTLSRTAVKEQDVKVLMDVCGASEPKNKKVEATTRTPFSVYTSRSATTSSSGMTSKRPTMPARSLHNVHLGNEKSASCRPPRIVARKEHKAGRNDCREPREDTVPCGNVNTMEGKVMQAKHMTPMLNKQTVEDSAVIAYGACMQDQQTHTSNDMKECVSAQPIVQEQSYTMKDKPVTSLVCNEEKQPSLCYKENERECRGRHAFPEKKQDSAQSTLEKHLENLYLSTPSNKLVPHTHKHCGVEVEMGALDHSNNVSMQEIGQLQCVNSVVGLEMVSSQHDDDAQACEMEVSHHVEGAAKLKEVLSHYGDVGQSLNCPLQSSSSFNRNQPFNSQNASHVKYSASQVTKSLVDVIHLAPLSSNMDTQRNPKQLQPAKDWQRNRGLKRKSSELNFKVNCSSKDHIHEHDKVPTSGASVSSFMCQQTKQSSSLTRPFMKAPPASGFIDSCKEQHKKIKTTTKAQPFKPFRLRTEERGALREVGLARKEQVVPNPQELVHHALRMPSFGHPFRPQRSTKKLTVPKEPSFHSSRMRKTCTGPPTTLLGS